MLVLHQFLNSNHRANKQSKLLKPRIYPLKIPKFSEITITMQFSSIVAAFTFALAASAIPVIEERTDNQPSPPTCSADSGSPKCCDKLQPVSIPVIGGLINVIAGIGCVNAVSGKSNMPWGRSKHDLTVAPVTNGLCSNNQKVQCCKSSSAPALVSLNALNCVQAL